jgi:AcrR family transcriptional regulator
MRKPQSSSVETRELILSAAGRIFAKNGFHATTVRQITREAGVNLAAVNYHFHDKQELYVSVLKRAHQAAANTAEADHAGTPRQQLRAFVRMFLAYLLDPKRPQWQGSLIAREMSQPTQALDRLVAESVEPVKQRVQGIVKELVGPGVPESQVNLSCLSIMGQCLHYVHCREMISRLFPDKRRGARDVDALAEHIYHFSLAGLNAVKSREKASSPARLRSRPKVSL